MRCSLFSSSHMVEVRILGALWEHLEPRLELDSEGREISVGELLAHLGIDPAEVGIVTVDRRPSDLTGRVPASCRVFIFPPMSGG
jgi:molybdopterin converting factor small subunit